MKHRSICKSCTEKRNIERYLRKMKKQKAQLEVEREARPLTEVQAKIIATRSEAFKPDSSSYE